MSEQGSETSPRGTPRGRATGCVRRGGHLGYSTDLHGRVAMRLSQCVSENRSLPRRETELHPCAHQRILRLWSDQNARRIHMLKGNRVPVWCMKRGVGFLAFSPNAAQDDFYTNRPRSQVSMSSHAHAMWSKRMRLSKAPCLCAASCTVVRAAG